MRLYIVRVVNMSVLPSMMMDNMYTAVTCKAR